nr:hydrogenase maturation nickel metallochaperone HypA [Nanoarchaeota archaeon]
MHETIIVNKILEQVNKKAKGKKVKSITLEVGDLAHLLAEELKGFLINMVNFEVIVKPVKARVKCGCGYKGEPRILVHEHDFSLFECPRCSKTPRVLSGEDIVLKEVKTE